MDTYDLVCAAVDRVEIAVEEGEDFDCAVMRASEELHIGYKMIETMYVELYGRPSAPQS